MKGSAPFCIGQNRIALGRREGPWLPLMHRNDPGFFSETIQAFCSRWMFSPLTSSCQRCYDAGACACSAVRHGSEPGIYCCWEAVCVEGAYAGISLVAL